MGRAGKAPGPHDASGPTSLKPIIPLDHDDERESVFYPPGLHLAQIDPRHPKEFSAVLDSGAGIHTAPGNSDMLLDVTPSGVRARLADDSTVRADLKGTLVRCHNSRDDLPITVHRIPGSTGWLHSIPLLLEQGHDFFLTNKGTSYEIFRDADGQLTAFSRAAQRDDVGSGLGEPPDGAQADS